MQPFKPSPKQLERLFTHTHQALRLYYDKDKWSIIYPTLSQLAERFVLMYEQYPDAMHAHLQIYAKDFGYTTNLVINQSIIICAFCHSLGYKQALTEQLVIAALADQLCTTNESNHSARGKPLDEQAQRLLQMRHKLAVKMLNKGGVPIGQVQRILSRLEKYSTAVTGVKPIPLFDNPTLLVALTLRIARAITPRPRLKTFSIVQAIKSLYISCYNEYAQRALQGLARQVAKHPAGMQTLYKQDNAIVLSQSASKYTLAIFKNNELKGLVKTNKQIRASYKPIYLQDTNLLYKVWFNTQMPVHALKNLDTSSELAVVAKLGNAKYQEFKAIEKCVEPFSDLSIALQNAAKQYNRQGQKAGNLRHCLTMVGLDTAALLCQRVLLETLISKLQHPFGQDIWHKYTHINKVITTLISKKSHEQFEYYLSPFAAFVFFILENHPDEVMRFVNTEQTNFEESPTSIAQLFGFKTLDTQKVDAFSSQYFNHSHAHNAFKQTEQLAKRELSMSAKHFVLIKLLAILSLSTSFKLTSWQKELLDEILYEFNWQSFDEFKLALIETAPYSSIE